MQAPLPDMVCSLLPFQACFYPFLFYFSLSSRHLLAFPHSLEPGGVFLTPGPWHLLLPQFQIIISFFVSFRSQLTFRLFRAAFMDHPTVSSQRCPLPSHFLLSHHAVVLSFICRFACCLSPRLEDNLYEDRALAGLPTAGYPAPLSMTNTWGALNRCLVND